MPHLHALIDDMDSGCKLDVRSHLVTTTTATYNVIVKVVMEKAYASNLSFFMLGEDAFRIHEKKISHDISSS